MYKTELTLALNIQNRKESTRQFHVHDRLCQHPNLNNKHFKLS